jgi:ATP-dependent Clp protease ATP-binding subunit ClpB
VRRKPFTVILFDEVEKAHHDVFNVLLQVLDDGRLTDSQGRTVDFKNTVLIMTSNLGSQEILEAQQRNMDYEALRALVLQEIQQHFRPEFLNRVDEVVVFHSLTQEELGPIVEIQLQRLRARLADRQMTLELSQSVVSDLAARGYDPVYGARPLKRLIQQDIETPLSRLIIQGQALDGQTIVGDIVDGKLVLTAKETVET